MSVYAVAVLIDGVADLSVLHEPDVKINGEPPLSAEARCGAKGYVYLRSGLPATAGACEGCKSPYARPRPSGGRRRWDQDTIVAAMRRWHETHGRQPSGTDWLLKGEWWPSASTCRDVFGTWVAALEAAGFGPGRAGRQRKLHPHGTEQRYFQGCRLECCRAAHRDAARARYRAARPWLRERVAA